MFETNEVSIHAVRVFTALEAGTWMTAAQLATEAKVAPRTARLYCRRFVDAGIVELAELYPQHRYRLAPKADRRNKAYVLRLRQARDAFENR